MKVAIVHDWLTGMRGGERCLEAFCELFPDADVYTLLHIKRSVSLTIERHRIRTSFIQSLPLAERYYRYYLPLFPLAIERFRLPAYDLVLSSSHCVAKGIRPPAGAKHLCYIHAPMRYVWDQFENYAGGGRSGVLARLGMTLFRKRLQEWDIASATRVDQFVANSHNIARKVEGHYHRSAAVLHPPVDWQTFQAAEQSEDFYFMVTAFAPYKRVDLAIQACNVMKRRLKIIGKGQEEARLRKLAGPTVEFLGWQPDSVVRDHYARCRALLFPGEEDFGIVPLEAMACGKPVVAFGRGGALETVVPLPGAGSMTGAGQSATGVFFYTQSVESLVEAMEIYERRRTEFDPHAIRAHVATFDRRLFKERLQAFAMGALTGTTS
ncbi:MAG: Putative Glycosyl transferase, group 1 [Nitrospira sp.]|nr:glycosyltransferase [Nitrospira sp.]ULA60228.1 MAG: Putative Glycosyl transferase, group 1 [Nitrospira sp.]